MTVNEENALYRLKSIHEFKYSTEYVSTWGLLTLDQICDILRGAITAGKSEYIIDGGAPSVEIRNKLKEIGFDVKCVLHPDTFCPLTKITFW